MITVFLFGVAYFLIGVVFPNPPASDPHQFAWRVAAWVLSFGAFFGQIGLEHFLFRSKPRTTAFRTGAAVALGALAIAISANIHAMNSTAGHRGTIALAMVIWPIAGGLLGAAAAWVVAAVLGWFRVSDRPSR